jgi:hypothetical protein
MEWVYLVQDREKWLAHGFTKCLEFLDWLRNYQLIKKDCAPARCSY